MASQTELTTSQFPGAAGTAPAGQVTAVPQGKRLLFVDNLRILLICGVVVQQLSVTYGAAGSWMYTDPATDQFAFCRAETGEGDIRGNQAGTAPVLCARIGSI